MKASTVMSSKTARVTSWVMAALLLLASGWSFNIATYNWFAADYHNEYSHAYASRGNIFFIVALALLAAFVWVIVAILRSGKKRRMAKT
jgi:uncharacterized membrane protein YidH (DUF202 family)